MSTFCINNTTINKEFDCICSFTTICKCKICCSWINSSIKNDSYYINKINIKMNYCTMTDFCNNLNINLYFEYKGKLITQLRGLNIKYNEFNNIVDNELQIFIGEITINFGKKQEINPIEVENLRMQNEIALTQFKEQIQNDRDIFEIMRPKYGYRYR